MSKLLCNVLRFSGGGKCPKCPHLVAGLAASVAEQVLFWLDGKRKQMSFAVPMV